MNYKFFVMKRILTFTFLFFLTFELMGQYVETIRTARPGRSMGTFTVGERVLQVQGSFELLEDIREASERNLTQSTLAVRYGISERFELNTAWAFNWETTDTPLGSRKLSGVSGSQIGFRVNVSDGTNAPPMAFQYRIKLRAVSEDYKKEFAGSRAVFAIAQPLGKKKNMRAFANIGLDWDGASAAPTGIYALEYMFALVPRLVGTIEYSGKVPLVNDVFNQTWTSNWGLGLSYTVYKDLKIDMFAGGNIAEISDQLFLNLGFSWRTRFAERIKNLPEGDKGL